MIDYSTMVALSALPVPPVLTKGITINVFFLFVCLVFCFCIRLMRFPCRQEESCDCTRYVYTFKANGLFYSEGK